MLNRPWFWNLLLLLLLGFAGVQVLSALNRPSPHLPQTPQAVREPRSYPLPSPPPEAAAYGDIAGRNLFSPERGKVTETPAEAPAGETPPPAEPPKATLFGVVIEDDGGIYAFLSDLSQGTGTRPKKYRAGDSFSNAVVKEIRPDRVIFTVGPAEHTVALRTPKEGLPPIVKPPPPRAPRRVVPRNVPRPPSDVPPDLQGRRTPQSPSRISRPSFRRRSTRRSPAVRAPREFADEEEEFAEEYLEEEDPYYDDPQEYYEPREEEPW